MKAKIIQYTGTEYLGPYILCWKQKGSKNVSSEHVKYSYVKTLTTILLCLFMLANFYALTCLVSQSFLKFLEISCTIYPLNAVSIVFSQQTHYLIPMNGSFIHSFFLLT